VRTGISTTCFDRFYWSQAEPALPALRKLRKAPGTLFVSHFLYDEFAGAASEGRYSSTENYVFAENARTLTW